MPKIWGYHCPLNFGQWQTEIWAVILYQVNNIPYLQCTCGMFNINLISNFPSRLSGEVHHHRLYYRYYYCVWTIHHKVSLLNRKGHQFLDLCLFYWFSSLYNAIFGMLYQSLNSNFKLLIPIFSRPIVVMWVSLIHGHKQFMMADQDSYTYRNKSYSTVQKWLIPIFCRPIVVMWVLLIHGRKQLMMADRDSYTYRNKSYCMVRTNGVPFLSRYIHLIANFSDHVGIHMQQTPYV